MICVEKFSFDRENFPVSDEFFLSDDKNFLSGELLCFVLHAFDILLEAFYAQGIHVDELRGERRELARVHSERVVHHEHVSVGEFAAADADGDAFHLAGNLLAEFFGDVLENQFETSETVDELCSFFNGAKRSFFSSSAWLIEQSLCRNADR